MSVLDSSSSESLDPGRLNGSPASDIQFITIAHTSAGLEGGSTQPNENDTATSVIFIRQTRWETKTSPSDASVAQGCCLSHCISLLTQEQILHWLGGQRSLFMCMCVNWVDLGFFRFTPGAAAQLEKKRMGPSQADVEAIKVCRFVRKAQVRVSGSFVRRQLWSKQTKSPQKMT